MKQLPDLPFGSNVSGCMACGLVFGSVFAFENHLVGDYNDPADPRRCLSTAELTERGWATDNHDYWRTPSKAEKARRAQDKIGFDDAA